LDQEIGGLGFVQPGGFRVAETEEEYFFLAKDLKERNRYGLGIVQMPIEEVRRIAPYISDSLKGANYCLWDGYVDARVATQRIALAARSRGVEIVTNNAVIKIKWKNRSCIFVITKKQQYRCRRLLIAAGVWTRQLGRFLDLDLPLNLRINQMVVTSRYPRLIEHMITHARGHLTLKQLDCGSILIGGGWPGAGDLSQDIKRPRYESIVGNVAVAVRVVPELAPIEAIRTWAGFDGRTNDELPILGPVPEKGNVFLATGCFGGYVAGPYIGKLMAQMMIGQKPEMSIDAFSVRRFS
jgi:glycine/D-amino acid oxidase-like deaminating enzyme